MARASIHGLSAVESIASTASQETARPRSHSDGDTGLLFMLGVVRRFLGVAVIASGLWLLYFLVIG